MNKTPADKPTAASKPVRAKRPKRSKDNFEFDAFTRRILKAYGQRVASGDIEALRCLVTLSAELDATLRLAVAGLRGASYTWDAIGEALGITRQAAQMRFGDKTERGALDQRLIAAGLHITVATLVEVFADHHPGVPAASACPGCGFRYPDGVTDCSTNATVRPLLYRRRGENPKALDRLSEVQHKDLFDRKTARTNRVAAARSARPAVSSAHTEPALFALNGKD